MKFPAGIEIKMWIWPPLLPPWQPSNESCMLETITFKPISVNYQQKSPKSFNIFMIISLLRTKLSTIGMVKHGIRFEYKDKFEISLRK